MRHSVTIYDMYMDLAKLEFFSEVTRTVERFGLLGGKLSMPSKYLDTYRQCLVISLLLNCLAIDFW